MRVGKGILITPLWSRAVAAAIAGSPGSPEPVVCVLGWNGRPPACEIVAPPGCGERCGGLPRLRQADLQMIQDVGVIPAVLAGNQAALAGRQPLVFGSVHRAGQNNLLRFYLNPD